MQTDNLFMIGITAVPSKMESGQAVVDTERIVVMRPPANWTLTKEQALNLAAWLVALSDDSAQHDKFRTLLKRIEES